jgi:hypothetical protein
MKKRNANQRNRGGSLSSVFVCYAEDDCNFVNDLGKRLKGNGQDAAFELTGLRAGRDSQEEVHSRIEAADICVFVVSPSSLNSQTWLEQLSFAVKTDKKLVPVLRQDVSVLPEALAGHGTIPFRQNDNPDQALAALLEATEADFKLDAFISYSRKDQTFVLALREAFKKSQRKSWIDQRDIPPTERWKNAIESGIEAASSFLFIISPDSVVSKNCAAELAYASKLNKRLVPVLYRKVDMNVVPQSLAEFEAIPFQADADFDSAFRLLLSAVETDLEYVRTHTRLLIQAIDWDRGVRDGSLLLRGRRLTEARQWLAQSESNESRHQPRFKKNSSK